MSDSTLSLRRVWIREIERRTAAQVRTGRDTDLWGDCHTQLIVMTIQHVTNFVTIHRTLITGDRSRNSYKDEFKTNSYEPNINPG